MVDSNLNQVQLESLAVDAMEQAIKRGFQIIVARLQLSLDLTCVIYLVQMRLDAMEQAIKRGFPIIVARLQLSLDLTCVIYLVQMRLDTMEQAIKRGQIDRTSSLKFLRDFNEVQN